MELRAITLGPWAPFGEPFGGGKGTLGSPRALSAMSTLGSWDTWTLSGGP